MILQTMKQALEALENDDVLRYRGNQIASKLRAAIEQMEKAEPVAMFKKSTNGTVYIETFGGLCSAKELVGVPLYTHPAQPPEGWLRAVDEAMVCSHLGTAEATDSYEVAKKKLNDLICWNVAVATDLAGWQLVPMKPTPEMIRASWDQAGVGVIEHGKESYISIAYEAMLRAAPKEKS